MAQRLQCVPERASLCQLLPLPQDRWTSVPRFPGEGVNHKAEGRDFTCWLHLESSISIQWIRESNETIMYSPANAFLTTGTVPVRIYTKQNCLSSQNSGFNIRTTWPSGCWRGEEGCASCPEWGRWVHLQRDGDHQPCSDSACTLSSSLPQPDPLGKFGMKSPFFFPLSFLFDLSLVLHWCWQQLRYAKVIPCIKWWQLCLFLGKLLALWGLILKVQAFDEGIPHLWGSRPAFGLGMCDQLCLQSHTWS